MVISTGAKTGQKTITERVFLSDSEVIPLGRPRMWSPTLPEWDLHHEDGLSCEVVFLLSLLLGEEFDAFCVALWKKFPHF